MREDEVQQVLDFYPRVFYACHTRHVTHPESKAKLTAHQASILDHLDDEEPVSLFDLALHMGVTPSTMSIAVSRLVRLRLVRRDRDRGDARRVQLRLAPAGSRLKKAKSVLDPERVRSVLKRLSTEERDEAVRGLGLLAYAAELEMKSRSLSRAWRRRALPGGER